MKKVWLPLQQRVQGELIKRGHCVGCARSLADADREPHPYDESKEFVYCECRRIYIYDKQLNFYRRATVDEVKKEPTAL